MGRRDLEVPIGPFERETGRPDPGRGGLPFPRGRGGFAGSVHQRDPLRRRRPRINGGDLVASPAAALAGHGGRGCAGIVDDTAGLYVSGRDAPWSEAVLPGALLLRHERLLFGRDGRFSRRTLTPRIHRGRRMRRVFALVLRPHQRPVQPDGPGAARRQQPGRHRLRPDRRRAPLRGDRVAGALPQPRCATTAGSGCGSTDPWSARSRPLDNHPGGRRLRAAGRAQREASGPPARSSLGRVRVAALEPYIGR